MNKIGVVLMLADDWFPSMQRGMAAQNSCKPESNKTLYVPVRWGANGRQSKSSNGNIPATKPVLGAVSRDGRRS